MNRKEKFLVRNEKYSIYCHKNYGPYFGYFYPELYLPNTLDKGESNEYQEQYSSFTTGRKLTNGEQKWDVKEIEIYKIEYI